MTLINFTPPPVDPAQQPIIIKNINMIRLFPGTPLYKFAVKTDIIQDELDFLEKGCPLTNVSKLPQPEYQLLIDKCNNYMSSKNALMRKPLRLNFDLCVHHDGTVDFTLHCQNCFAPKRFVGKHFWNLKTNSYEGCSKCGSIMHPNLVNFFSQCVLLEHSVRVMETAQLQKYSGSRAVIWGINIWAQIFLVVSPILREIIVGVVDSAYGLHASEQYCGLSVHSPYMLSEMEFDVILTPVADTTELEQFLQRIDKSCDIIRI